MSNEITVNAACALNSIMNSRSFRVIHGLCEFIDNSLSAKATEIEIQMSATEWIVNDNGIGTENPRKIVEPFKSDAMDNTSRYGIGAATSIIHITDYGKVKIVSFTEKHVAHQEMDWSLYKNARSGGIEIPQPTFFPPVNYTGTKITMDVSRRSHKIHIDNLIEILEFRYAQALRQGVELKILKREHLYHVKPYQNPKFKTGCKAHKQIQHNKFGKLDVLIGIVKDGESNPYAGFNVYWGKRILMEKQGQPAGNRNVNPNRIYSVITLDDSTFDSVNTYKDGWTLSSEDENEFWQFISDTFADLIDQAAEAVESRELAIANRQAQMLLNQMLGDSIGMEKRNSHNKTQEGTVKSTETEKKRKSAIKVADNGDVKQKKGNGGGLKINLQPDSTQSDPWTVINCKKFWSVTYNPALLLHGINTPEAIAAQAYTLVIIQASDPDNGFLPLDGDPVTRFNQALCEARLNAVG